ncbi:hypothetical protein [Tepidibacter aestuarii]|uniref:hypothetical protein n=1 Tax=Tepidibacter aestuarii TaxID=2925782 RepID=UPI0020BFDB15|nr:hypothetical protein [Tepidibacter aestuarii]CAH2215146.1 protein of unknown function [Tepidibacter aestuarii]
MRRRKKENKTGVEKSAEINAREATKRMGLEYGSELLTEAVGTKFVEGPNASEKRSKKNNKTKTI